MKEKEKEITFTQNRELSRLKFDERVLDEADDERVPLFERMKFFSIFDSNLDEFFMVRIGSLSDLERLGIEEVDKKSGLDSKEQIDRATAYCKELYKKKDKVFGRLKAELIDEGIYFPKISNLEEDQYQFLKNYYDNILEPILEVRLFDKISDLHRVENLGLYCLFFLEGKGEDAVGIIKVPDNIDRFVLLSNNMVILVEDMIKEFGESFFTGRKVTEKVAFSLTRNTDMDHLDIDFDDDDDFREEMKEMIKHSKFLQVVRVEVDKKLKADHKKMLLKRYMLDEDSFFVSKSPLKVGFIYDLLDKFPEDLQKKHSYEKYSPQDSAMVDLDKPIIPQIEKKDLLLSFPYEKIDPFIQLLYEAARDPSVKSIDISLYRIAENSKVAQELIEAKKAGKRVNVVIELRARFDEKNNIYRSRKLQEAGCNISYGIPGYKCHCKVCLIEREIDGETTYITQVGTGNYNEKTAKQYTDFQYITTRKEIGEDATELFKNIKIGNLMGTYQKLMVSPYTMPMGLENLIDGQIERQRDFKDGYIRIKMNSISDLKLIDKLSEASNAGVKIDLLVRGICCILPGIKGKTENITVHQIVGRYLEHHRVYQFGQRDVAKVYISSADRMTRNIRKRVEVACPIEDEEIRERLLDFLDLMFSDDVKTRILKSDGTYESLDGQKGIIAQRELQNEAIARAKEAQAIKETARLQEEAAKKAESAEVESPKKEEVKKVEEGSAIQRFFKKIASFFKR